ncbi:hypothetical protein I2W78_00810 [Streptomyces spinoverrucosus]|uniref:hypothetical protein n=1 Tax=Streptomyces spinoverrucosus TaxID=284043 RepID=UPI0018C43578|nr:hypothetical protein [Streptomyces spinoverrucosus]MBG0850436.1 hypothetical protein [Streptomyces spinoverrucosus]
MRKTARLPRTASAPRTRAAAKAAKIVAGAAAVVLAFPATAAQAQDSAPAAQDTGLVFMNKATHHKYQTLRAENQERGMAPTDAAEQALTTVQARTADVVNNAAGPRTVSMNPWFTLATPKDREGLPWPVRDGIRGEGTNFKKGFGYLKYSEKHNFRSVSIIQVAIERGDKIPPGNFGGPTFSGFVVGYSRSGQYVNENTVIGTNAQPFSHSLQQNSPDGLPVGVITAWCKGKTLCPSAMNEFGL